MRHSLLAFFPALSHFPSSPTMFPEITSQTISFWILTSDLLLGEPPKTVMVPETARIWTKGVDCVQQAWGDEMESLEQEPQLWPGCNSIMIYLNTRFNNSKIMLTSTWQISLKPEFLLSKAIAFRNWLRFPVFHHSVCCPIIPDFSFPLGHWKRSNTAMRAEVLLCGIGLGNAPGATSLAEGARHSNATWQHVRPLEQGLAGGRVWQWVVWAKGRKTDTGNGEISVELPVPLELHIQVKHHCHFSEVSLVEWPVVLRDNQTVPQAGTISGRIASEWRWQE